MLRTCRTKCGQAPICGESLMFANANVRGSARACMRVREEHAFELRSVTRTVFACAGCMRTEIPVATRRQQRSPRESEQRPCQQPYTTAAYACLELTTLSGTSEGEGGRQRDVGASLCHALPCYHMLPVTRATQYQFEASKRDQCWKKTRLSTTSVLGCQGCFRYLDQ
jgi:hypothetical protein